MCQASKFRKVAAFFRAHPESITPAFEPLFDAENISPKAIQRLFALLASTNLQMCRSRSCCDTQYSMTLKVYLVALTIC